MREKKKNKNKKGTQKEETEKVQERTSINQRDEEVNRMHWSGYNREPECEREDEDEVDRT